MTLTKTQKTQLAVVSTFENGKPNTYGRTYWSPTTRELSGGLMMASFQSGNMALLLIKYLKSGGSLIPQSLINAAVTKNSASLGVDGIQVFRDTFKAAGKDPIMQEVQQDFFVKNFLTRAEDYAKSLNLTEPLSILVVLDSLVQGSFSRVSSLVPKFYQDTQNPLNEWDWVRSYLNTRYKWLATNPNTALNPTADRVQSLIDIEKSDNWKLNLPLTLSTKGITITDSDVI